MDFGLHYLARLKSLSDKAVYFIPPPIKNSLIFEKFLKVVGEVRENSKIYESVRRKKAKIVRSGINCGKKI